MKSPKAIARAASQPPTHAQWSVMPIEARLAYTDRLLARPAPAPFDKLGEYLGPNYPEKVNALLWLAKNIAKGAINDAMMGVCLMADEWRQQQRQCDEFRELVLELHDLDPDSVRKLLAEARKLVRLK